MMALEVLAPVTDKHPAAASLLIDLQEKIDARLAIESDIEARGCGVLIRDWRQHLKGHH